jgi:hypothetical protein
MLVSFISIFAALLVVLPTKAANFYHGEWLQPCTVINEDDEIQNLIMVDAKTFDLVTFAYEQEGCKSAYLIFKRNYSFNESDTYLTSAAQSIQLKAIVEKVSYTSLTDEVTEALNLINYCGDSDWVTYREKIVTGRICGDYRVPAEKTTEKFLIQTTNSSAIFLNSETVPYNRL